MYPPAPQRERENLHLLLVLPMSSETIRNINATRKSTPQSKPLSKPLRSAINQRSASCYPQDPSENEYQSANEEAKTLHLDPTNEEAFSSMPTTKAPRIEQHDTNLPSYASMASKPAPSGPQPVSKNRASQYDNKRYQLWPEVRDCIHYVPFGIQSSDTASTSKKAVSGTMEKKKCDDEQAFMHKPTKEQKWRWQAKQALQAALANVPRDAGPKQLRGHMRPCEKLVDAETVDGEMGDD